MQPDDEKSASALRQVLVDIEGFTEEEAAASVQLTQLLAKREYRYSQACELMALTNPDRNLILQSVLGEVGQLDASSAAFELTRGGCAPQLVEQNVTANDLPRRALVRVGADWILKRYSEISGKAKPEKESHTKTRKQGHAGTS